VTYPATGRSGADFPEDATLREALNRSSLLLALTEYSTTAALVDVCRRRPGAHVFRAASMPGVEKRMEGTALAADYAAVARRCKVLKDAFDATDAAIVTFSTGHTCRFDYRFRACETDDGYLHRDKSDDVPVINLPSGETFVVPYEGERPDEPSRTEGELPVMEGEDLAVFKVLENRIVEVGGSSRLASRYRAFFEDDPARANIAELAFGCNERAVVTGNVLEDEKAGFHWAFGRSDHLGGVVGLAAFRSPATVVHQDIVYARTSPIQVLRAELLGAKGRRIEVIRGGAYRLW
jgi:leucyl aminopeptidase (aminopeptidase T)